MRIEMQVEVAHIQQNNPEQDKAEAVKPNKEGSGSLTAKGGKIECKGQASCIAGS